MTEIPIPNLRDDLKYNEIIQQGIKYFIVYDDLGLVKQPIAFQEEELEIIKLIDGKNTINNLMQILKYKEDKLYNLIGFANLLAQNGFLETDEVNQQKIRINKYLKSEVRPSVCAGTTYPANTYELTTYLNYLLNSSENTKEKYPIIFAPHLDYRTGKDTHKTYSKAFNSLDIKDVELIVIIGTGHYRSSGDFMLTKKNYITPYGEVETDKEILKLLEDKVHFPLNYDDLAHLNEHSIELHLVILQHIMGSKKFKILPILTGSTHNYSDRNTSPLDSPQYIDFIDNLRNTIAKYNKKTLFLASGDLSHIGQKFGDKEDAKEIEINVKEFDTQIIEKLTNIDKLNFFKQTSSELDTKRVCGLFPFFATLDLTQPKSASKFHYHFWYEEDTKSAVSICSLGFK